MANARLLFISPRKIHLFRSFHSVHAVATHVLCLFSWQTELQFSWTVPSPCCKVASMLSLVSVCAVGQLMKLAANLKQTAVDYSEA